MQLLPGAHIINGFTFRKMLLSILSNSNLMKTHYAGNYSLRCAVAIQPITYMTFLLFPVAGRHYHTAHVWRPLFQNVRAPFHLLHVYYST